MTISASPAETTRDGILPRALAAPALKLVLIGLLLLALVAPLSYIGGLIQEQQGRQAEVLAEFKSNLGAAANSARPDPRGALPFPARPARESERTCGALRNPSPPVGEGG